MFSSAIAGSYGDFKDYMNKCRDIPSQMAPHLPARPPPPPPRVSFLCPPLATPQLPPAAWWHLGGVRSGRDSAGTESPSARPAPRGSGGAVRGGETAAPPGFVEAGAAPAVRRDFVLAANLGRG